MKNTYVAGYSHYYKIFSLTFLLFLGIGHFAFGQTTAAAGNWNVGSTWVGGVVPIAGATVTIAHNVTVPTAYTTPALNTVTINTARTLTNSGTIIAQNIVGSGTAALTNAANGIIEVRQADAVYFTGLTLNFTTIPNTVRYANATGGSNGTMALTNYHNVELLNAGYKTLPNGSINVTGSWSESGVSGRNITNSTINFVGTTNSAIGLTGFNVVINKTGGAKIFLGGGLSGFSGGTLTLTSGMVDNSGGYFIFFDNFSGGSATNYIQMPFTAGGITRGSVPTATNTTFPIGTATTYNPITFQTSTAGLPNITVRLNSPFNFPNTSASLNLQWDFQSSIASTTISSATINWVAANVTGTIAGANAQYQVGDWASVGGTATATAVSIATPITIPNAGYRGLTAFKSLDFYSIGNAFWNTVGNWSYTFFGTDCNCNPSGVANANIVVASSTTATAITAAHLGTSNVISVQNTGTLDLQSGNANAISTLTTVTGATVKVGGTLNLASPTTTTINGTLQSEVSGVVPNGMTFTNGSAYVHARNGGSIPTATWGATSTVNVTGIVGTALTGLGQTFGNFTWDNAGQTVQQVLDGNMTLAGDMTITNANTSNFSMGTGTFGIDLKGNFSNANTTYFNGGTGTGSFTFSGIFPQTITGTGATTFRNLIINNTGTTPIVTLGAAVTVSNNLTLTNGRLVLGLNNLSYGGTVATIPRTNGWIQTNNTGTFIRTVAGTNFTFPVGDATGMRLVTFATTTAGTNSARFTTSVLPMVTGTLPAGGMWVIASPTSSILTFTGVGGTADATGKIYKDISSFWTSQTTGGTFPDFSTTVAQTSGNFTIFTPSTNFYTLANATWNVNSNNWSNDGVTSCNCSPAGIANANVRVRGGHTATVTNAADMGATNIIDVQSTGVLTLSNGNTNAITTLTTSATSTINVAAGTLNLATPATTTINGTVNVTGTGTVPNGMTFANGSTYIHAKNGGAVPTATWGATSTVNITGVTNTMPTGFAQTFGNLVWNSAQTAALNFFTTFATMTTQGDFSILNVGTGSLTLLNGASSTVTLNVGGNFVQSGNANFSLGNSIGSITVNMAVTGNFTQTSTADFSLVTAGSVSVAANLSLAGNLTMSRNILTNGTNINRVLFTGTNNQTVAITGVAGNAIGGNASTFSTDINKTAGTVTLASNYLVATTVGSGAGSSTLNIISGTLTTDATPRTIEIGNLTGTGTLDMSNGSLAHLLRLRNTSNSFTGTLTSSINSTVEYNSSSAGQNMFAPAAGSYGNILLTNATLKTTNTGSFNIIGNFTNNAGVGNFNIDPPYTVNFIGTTNQTITGATLIRNLVVNKASGLLLLANNITVGEILTLQNGRVQIGANTLTYSGTEANLTRTNGWIETNSTGTFTRSASGANFTFPVGSATQYQPLRIVTSAANAGVRFGTSTLTVPNAGAGSWFVNNGTTNSDIILLNPQGTLTAASRVYKYNTPIVGNWNSLATSFSSPDYTATAALTGVTAEFSVFIPVPTDYYTLGNATWNVNSNNWSNDGIVGCNCSPAGVIGATVRIQTGHTATVANAADIATTNIIDIQGTGVLTLNNGNTNAISTLTTSATSTMNVLAGTLTLAAATTINGTLSNQGATIPATPALTFANGSAYIHARDGGTIPTATWGATSTVNITGITNTTITSGFGQSFGDFTWNCAGQVVAQGINANMIVKRNLTVVNTGITNFSPAGFTLTINGNLSRTGGTFNQGTSTVIFNGGVPQTMTGIATLYNLILNQTLTLSGSALLVQNALTLTAGRVVLGANNLTYGGTEANLARTAGWIETNGAGAFIRTGTPSASNNFYVGDATAMRNVVLTTFSNPTSVRFTTTFAPATSNPNLAAGMWVLTGTGTSTIALKNVGASPVVTSKIYQSNAGGAWIPQATNAPTLPDFTTTNTITLATDQRFTVFSTANFTTVAAGSWTTATNWSPASVPASGDNVTILHNINIPASTVVNLGTATIGASGTPATLTLADNTVDFTANTVNVDWGSTLDIANDAPTIQLLNSNGQGINTLRLSSGTGTANIVDARNFINALVTNNTVVMFEGGANYTIPTNLGQTANTPNYPDLWFNHSTGTKFLPDANLTTKNMVLNLSGGTVGGTATGGKILTINGVLQVKSGTTFGMFGVSYSTINLASNLIVDGTFNVSALTTAFNFTTANAATISGTTSPLSFNGASVNIAAGKIVTNDSPNIVMSGVLDGLSATSQWVQGANRALGYANSTPPMFTGIFDATTNSGNTVIYNGGNQTIRNTDYWNITLTNGGTKTIGGTSPIINVKGNWTNAVGGSVIAPGSSTVVFNGTVAQTIGGSFVSAFNNLTISNTTAGGVNILAATPAPTGTGTLNVVANALLRVGGANNFPSGFATYTLNTTSTVEYYGTAQTIFATATPAFNYGNLVLSGSADKTLSNNFTVNGNLTVNTAVVMLFGGIARTVTVNGDLSGATGVIDLSSVTHQLVLNGANNAIGALTTDSNNSVVLYNRAGNQQVIASVNYRNLQIGNSGIKTLQGTTSANNALVFSGTSAKLALAGFNLTVPTLAAITGFDNTKYIITNSTGKLNADFAGGLVTAPIGISATSYDPIVFNTGAIANATYSFRVGSPNTNGLQNISGTGYANTVWEVSSTGSNIFTANQISFGWTSSTGSLTGARLRTGAGFPLPNLGSYSSGTQISNDLQNITINNTASQFATLVPLSGATYYTAVNGANWTNTAQWTLNPDGITALGVGVAAFTAIDNAILVSGASVNVTANSQVNVASVQVNAGAVLNFGAFGTQSVGVLSGSGTLIFDTGGLTLSGTNSLGAGATIIYQNGSYAIPDNFMGSNYPNLTINTTGTITLLAGAGSCTVNGNFSISGGTFDPLARNLTVNGTTNIVGTFQDTNLGGGNTFNGLVTLAGFGSINSNVSSVYNFGGGITNNSSTASVIGNTTVNFTANQSLSGSGTTTLPTVNIATNTVTNNNIVSITGNLSGTGTWINATNSTLRYAGAAEPMGAGNLTASAAGNTVEYNGGVQDIKPTTYHHLILTNNNVKSYLGDINILGNFTNSTGSSSNYAGTFTTIFNGTSPQNLTGATNFYNLIINQSPASTVTLAASSNVSVTNGLTLNSGKVLVGENTLLYGGIEANLTANSNGYLVTNGSSGFTGFIRNAVGLATGSPQKFPIGIDLGSGNYSYNPVEITYTTLPSANVLVRAGLPNTSGLPNFSATQKVNAVWQINQSNSAAISNIKFGWETANQVSFNAGTAKIMQNLVSLRPTVIGAQDATSNNIIQFPNAVNTFAVFSPPLVYETRGSTTWVGLTNWSTDGGVTDCGCSPSGVDNAQVTIKTGHTVTVANAGDIALTNVIDVQGTGVLTLSDGNTNAITTLTTSATSTINLNGTGNFNLASPATTTINGTLNRVTTGSVPNGMTFANGSTYIHARNGGVIPTATWGTTSTVNVTGITNSQLTGLNQTFGNFTWNNAGQVTPQDINTTMTVASTFTYTAGAGGIFIARGASATGSLIVKDYVQTSDILTLAGGNLANGTLSVSGNFNCAGTGIIGYATGPATTKLLFNGTGNQSFIHPNILGVGTGSTFTVEVNKASGSVVVGSDLTFPANGNNINLLLTNGTFAFGSPTVRTVNFTNIQGTGTLDMTGAAHTLNIQGTGNSFSGTLTSATNATINYNSTTAQNIFAPSSGSYANLVLTNNNIKTLVGNIDIIGNFTNSTGAATNYAGAFTTAFNSTANAQTITGATTFNNLTINNTSATPTVTLANAITVANALALSEGRLRLGANNLTYAGAEINLTRTNGWIETDGTGAFVRTGTAGVTNGFPVGDATALRNVVLGTFNNPTSVRFTPTITPTITGTLPSAGMWVVNGTISGASVALQNVGASPDATSEIHTSVTPFSSWTPFALGTSAAPPNFSTGANTMAFAGTTYLSVFKANDLTITSNAVAASNIYRGYNTNVVHSFALTAASTTVVSGFSGITAAISNPADFVNGSYKVYSSLTNNFSTATPVGLSFAVNVGSSANFTFASGLSIAAATTRYFWLTVDVLPTAIVGNTITVSGLSPANISTVGSVTGSALASGTQTIQALNTQPLSNRGIYFDGVDDVVTIPNNAAFNVAGTTPHTISFWLKTNLGIDRGIFSKAGAGGLQIAGFVTATGQVAFAHDKNSAPNGGWDILTTDAPVVENNKWVHIALVSDGTVAGKKIYINGSLTPATTGGTSPTFFVGATAASGNLSLGFGFVGGVTLGQLDDLRFYNNTAQLPAQIQSDMASTAPNGAVGYWNFEESTNTTAANTGTAGAAANGTLAGGSQTPLWALRTTNTLDDGLIGSLRWAINQANTDTDTDYLDFSIPTAGAKTITLATSDLPFFPTNRPLFLDGWSQEGSTNTTPMIEINGNNINNGIGLNLQADNSIIRGMVINRFNTASGGNDVGMYISGANNHIYGNYIGTDITGSTASPNTQIGIWIQNGSNNVIGTNNDGVNDINERNIIAGNGGYGNNTQLLINGGATANFVRNNYIGVNSTGNTSIGTANIGIDLASTGANTIGGNNAVSRNIIGGRTSGIRVNNSNGHTIIGNYIGLGADGTTNVANSKGVEFAGTAANNLVGNNTTNEANTIRFNTNSGIDLGGTNNIVRQNAIYCNDANNPSGILNSPVAQPTLTGGISGGTVTLNVGNMPLAGAKDIYFYKNTSCGTNQGEAFAVSALVVSSGTATYTYSGAVGTPFNAGDYITVSYISSGGSVFSAPLLLTSGYYTRNDHPNIATGANWNDPTLWSVSAHTDNVGCNCTPPAFATVFVAPSHIVNANVDFITANNNTPQVINLGGTLDLQNGNHTSLNVATVSINDNGGAGTLIIGGATAASAITSTGGDFFTTETNKVVYNGAGYNIANRNYPILEIAGTGNKLLPSGTPIDILGNLILSGGVAGFAPTAAINFPNAGTLPHQIQGSPGNVITLNNATINGNTVVNNNFGFNINGVVTVNTGATLTNDNANFQVINATSDITGAGTFSNTRVVYWFSDVTPTVANFDLTTIPNTIVYQAGTAAPRNTTYDQLYFRNTRTTTAGTITANQIVFDASAPAAVLNLANNTNITVNNDLTLANPNGCTIDFGTGNATVTVIGNLIGSIAGANITHNAGAGSNQVLELRGATNVLNVFTNATTLGTSIVSYNSTAPQQVFASPNYRNLELVGPSNKTLNGNVIVANALSLADNTLTLGANNLTYNGTDANLISTSGWVVTNSTGALIRNAAGTNFTFPVGSATTAQFIRVATPNTPASVRFGSPTLAVPNAGVGSWFVDNGTTNSAITLLNPQGSLDASSSIYKYNFPTAGSWNLLTTTYGAPNYTAATALTGLVAEFAAYSCPTITIDGTVLPNGTQNTLYSENRAIIGGAAAYTVAVTAGALPTGTTATILGSDVVISGTPTVIGTFNFTLTVTDANTCVSTPQAYTWVIDCPAITIDATVLPNGTSGAAYTSQNRAITGGMATYTVAVTAGTLPAGTTATVSGTNVVISGTPTVVGTFNFTLTVTDANTCTSTPQAYTWVIDCPAITIDATVLPNGTSGVAYTPQNRAITGGAATYTVAVTAGTLPAGTTATVSGTNVVISGTPTVVGTFNFTLTVTDANTCTSTPQAYTWVIDCPNITIDATVLPNGTQATLYSQNRAITGGVAAYTVAVTAGALPAGTTATVSGTNVVVSGTPTVVGTFNFTLTVTDVNTCVSTPQAYTWVIDCPAITIDATVLPNGTNAVAYTPQNRAITGGTAAYTVAVTAGTLPAGTTATVSGANVVISGTPTVTGTSNFTLTVTDANTCTSTPQAYTWVINPPLAYYSITNGDWGTNGTWSATSGGTSCGCTPTTGANIVIEGGFTVKATANGEINNTDVSINGTGSTLDLGTTTGHAITGSLGSTGNGTLKLASGTLPMIMLNSFATAAGATVEYADVSYNIPPTFAGTSYPNLSITGTGTKTFTAGTVTINGNLVVGTGTVLDAVSNSVTVVFPAGTHTIQTDGNANLSNVTINGNTTLLNAAAILNISGDMAVATGITFTNQNTSSIDFNTTASTLSGAGTFVNAANAQMTYRSNTTPTITTFTATALNNGVLYMQGTAAPFNTTYYNLFLRDTRATTASANIIAQNITLDQIDPRLNLAAGTTITTNNLSLINTNPIIDFGSGTATVIVTGDLSATVGTIIHNPNSVFVQTLQLQGASAVLGTFNNNLSASGTSIVRYSGVNQAVFPSNNYRNLEILGGGVKTLSAATTVNNTLTLTNGRLQLGANDLTLNNAIVSSQIAGAPYTNSWVETNGTGSLIRQGVTTGVDFPVGDATGVRLVNMTISGAGNNTVRFIPTITPSIGGGSNPAAGMWAINRAAGSTALTFSNVGGTANATSFIHSGGWLSIATTGGLPPYIAASVPFTGVSQNFTVFTPSPVVAPTIQSSNILFNSLASTTIGLQWTSGNGENRIVVASTNPNLFTAPTNGVTYTVGQAIGGGIVVYNSSGISTLATGLVPQTKYYFYVFDYNGTGASTTYNTSSAANNPNSISTLATLPPNQPTGLVVTVLEPTAFGGTFTPTNPNSAGYLVVIRLPTDRPTLPNDGREYPVGTQFFDGQVVISSGSAINFTTNNLQPATEYIIEIYAYNGSGETTIYKKDNPLSIRFTTPALGPVLTSIDVNEKEVGQEGFILFAKGNNFIKTTVLKWQGRELRTTYISRTELSAEITKDLLADAGVYNITASTPPRGGGESNALPFQVIPIANIKAIPLISRTVAPDKNDHLLYRVEIAAIGGELTLKELKLQTLGTYLPSDLKNPTFFLKYSTDENLDGSDVILATSSTVSSGGNITFNFEKVTPIPTLPKNKTSYLLLTVNIAKEPKIGNEIGIGAVSFENIQFFGKVNKKGNDPTLAGIKQKIISVTPTAQDYSALLKFYEAMSGKGWTAGWDLNAPVNTWRGVELDEEGRVIAVSLPENKLIGKISEALTVDGILIGTSLRYLNLSGNQIDGVIPTGIGTLKSLEYLDLSKNQLSGKLPESMSGLTNLITLWLNNNQLTEVNVDFGGLPNLRNLFLQFNNLDKLPNSIDKLTNLEALSIAGNSFITLPTTLGNLRKLKYLDISRNRLTQLPEGINTLSELEGFLMHANFISAVPQNLLDLRKLRLYTAQDNALTFGSLEPLQTWWSSQSRIDATYAPQSKIGRPQELIVQVGDPLTLSIPTSGTANKYQWSKNGIVISNTQNIVIQRVSVQDAGVYTLEVTNPLVPRLTLQSHAISLSVDCGKIISISKPKINVEGSNVFCAGEAVNTRLAVPQNAEVQSYKWFLDGVEISNSNTNSILANNAGRYTTQVVLQTGCSLFADEVVISRLPAFTVTLSQNQGVLQASTTAGREMILYEWFIDERIVANTTQATFLPVERGNYKVRVTDRNGCKSLSRVETISVVTAVEGDVYEGAIRLYPNPSNAIFYLEMGNEKANKIYLFNAIGQHFAESIEDLGNGKFRIDLDRKAVGIYFIEIHTEKGKIVKRLFKE